VTKISQRQARWYRREANRLAEILKNQRRSWPKEWPSSTVLGRLDVGDRALAIVETARRLNHAVVVVNDGRTLIMFGMEAGK